MIRTIGGYCLELNESESKKKPGYVELHIFEQSNHKTLYIENVVNARLWVKKLKKQDVTYLFNAFIDGHTMEEKYVTN